jgi:lipopolysaccharide transport system ATP-binding protein
MTTAIRTEGLGKSYLLRHEQPDRYVALRDVLTDGVRRLWRRLLSPLTPPAPRSSKEIFWALRDIDLEVQEGERLGIIGRNGAGKSTLLKVLGRITEPTRGRIEIRGRVSSLLEVGTGFHPELTGRENIFLNGAILGMSSGEIRRKFDEIVAFAEVERFLDTPVKRYSSGMYVRLAFAVAAYLEPDILIVDEVLAVGDVQFQRRCLGRMEELSNSGRTVIFVTHNMGALVALCTRGILLNQGAIAFKGTATEAREKYLSTVADLEYSMTVNALRSGSGGVSVTDVWLEDESGHRVTRLTRQSPVSLCLDAQVSDQFIGRADLEVAFSINTIEGHRLVTLVSSWSGQSLLIKSSRWAVTCDLPEVPLVPGKYLVDATIIFRGDTLDCVQHCASFEVQPMNDGYYAGRLAEHGVLDLPGRFRQRHPSA